METEEQMIARITGRVFQETGFRMQNPDKVKRAILGIYTSKVNELVGGVGEDATSAVILAKYDEHNGFITKNGYKVKNGAFYDRRTKQPVEKPKVIFLIRINDRMMEHEEGAEESLEIQLAKKQMKEKEAEDATDREEASAIPALKRSPGRPRKSADEHIEE